MPTPPPPLPLPFDLEHLRAHLDALHGTPLRYIAARLRDPEAPKAVIAANLGWSEPTIYQRRATLDAFRILDDAISAGKHALQIDMAIQTLKDQAPSSAQNLADIANSDAKTDRQIATKLQANVKVLEAVGVIKPNGTLNIQVDARRIDLHAVNRWQARRGLQQPSPLPLPAPDSVADVTITPQEEQ